MVRKHVLRADDIWADVRRGWLEYVSIPVSMIAYFSIIEYIAISIFPPLRNLSEGLLTIIVSLGAVFVCYRFGRVANKFDEHRRVRDLNKH